MNGRGGAWCSSSVTQRQGALGAQAVDAMVRRSDGPNVRRVSWLSCAGLRTGAAAWRSGGLELEGEMNQRVGHRTHRSGVGR